MMGGGGDRDITFYFNLLTAGTEYIRFFIFLFAQ